MSLNREKYLKAKGKTRKKTGIYKGSTGDKLAQQQAAPPKKVSTSTSNKYANMSIQERAEAKRQEQKLIEMKRKAEKNRRKAQTPAERIAEDKKRLEEANKQSSESRMDIEGVQDKDKERKRREAEEANKKTGSDTADTSGTEEGTSKSQFDVGLEKAEQILGPEGLRTAEMKDVMERRKQQADEGISQEEQLAMKTKLARQMMQAEQTAGLKLGSALGGMTGAATGAQVRSLQAQGLQARAGIERDIFMAQEAAKREGLDKLEATTQFDVGQKGKEMELKSTLGLGMERIDAIREGALLASEAASKSGGGKK